MRALLFLFTIISLPVWGRPPLFTETYCAHALFSVNRLPLIQPDDLRAQVNEWKITDLEKAELLADLDNPKVLTRAAHVRGETLTRFAEAFAPGLVALDNRLWIYRRLSASHLSAAKPLAAGAISLALGSLAMMSLGEHWVFQTLGLVGLVGSGRLAWTAYFHSSYEHYQPTLDGIVRLTNRLTLNLLQYPDGVPGFAAVRSTDQQRAWLNSRLVERLTHPGEREVSVPLLDETVEKNRRWPFRELVPGRVRVVITFHLGFDERGDKQLTLVARLKRPFKSVRPRSG